MLHRAGQFHYQLIHRFIFSEEVCKKVLFFDHRGRLQVLKVRDLKHSCLESIVLSRNLNSKIRLVRERKFSDV